MILGTFLSGCPWGTGVFGGISSFFQGTPNGSGGSTQEKRLLVATPKDSSEKVIGTIQLVGTEPPTVNISDSEYQWVKEKVFEIWSAKEIRVPDHSDENEPYALVWRIAKSGDSDFNKAALFRLQYEFGISTK